MHMRGLKVVAHADIQLAALLADQPLVAFGYVVAKVLEAVRARASGPVTHQTITPVRTSTCVATPQCVMGQPHDMPSGRPMRMSPLRISISRVMSGLCGKMISRGPGPRENAPGRNRILDPGYPATSAARRRSRATGQSLPATGRGSRCLVVSPFAGPPPQPPRSSRLQAVLRKVNAPLKHLGRNGQPLPQLVTRPIAAQPTVQSGKFHV